MTDQEIYEGLKNNDRQTIIYIYKTFLPKILGWIIRNGGTREDGEDIFSKTLMGVLKSIQDNRYEQRGLFEPYFWKYVRWLWSTELRRRKRKPINDDETAIEYASIDSIVKIMIEYEPLYQALEKLGEPYRSWLQRFYLEGYSCKELAIEENIDENTMRQRIHRCLKKLKELLKDK